MIELVVLAADKNIEATVTEILHRPGALGIRPIQFETLVHPHRDPGCFHQPWDLLGGYRDRAEHALVVLDRAWDGAPAQTGAELEDLLEGSLGPQELGGWARAVVVDPELEVWVFSDSPHVAEALGWRAGMGTLREALAARDLWPEGYTKPHDPKRALEWALRSARKPRSSSVYRELARHVGFARCHDRSFLRLKQLLAEWFGLPAGTV